MQVYKVDGYHARDDPFYWFHHELVILSNVVHWALLTYYLIYEIVAYLLARVFGLKQLPTLMYPRTCLGRVTDPNSTIANYTLHFIKFIFLIGASLNVLGVSNLHLRYLIAGYLITLPFTAVDIYLLWISQFHLIDAKDFLLFQTLLTTTFRSLRIVAMIGNTSLILIFLTTSYNISEFL